MNENLERPALGQSARLGDFYDARTNTFPGWSLFSDDLPEVAITTSDNHSTDAQHSFEDTFMEKFHKMKVSGELGASICTGWIKLSGSGSYLNETRETTKMLHASLFYNITTQYEKLNLLRCPPPSSAATAARFLTNGRATHAVTGIGWRACSVTTAKHQYKNKSERMEVEGMFKAEVTKFKEALDADGKVETEVNNRDED